MRLKFREVRLLDNMINEDPNQEIIRYDRSPGVHLSELLYDMGVKAGLMKDFGGLSTGYLAVGLAWEDWYGVRVLHEGKPINYHPGEVVLDGIACSPDGRSDGGLMGLGICQEIKTTKMSSKKKFADDWYYGMQIKCYSHAMGVREAHHHTLHINGNYGKSRAPKLIVRGFTFTARELREAWEQVLRHRDVWEGPRRR